MIRLWLRVGHSRRLQCAFNRTLDCRHAWLPSTDMNVNVFAERNEHEVLDKGCILERSHNDDPSAEA
jgi:hypothetical protein